MPSVDVMVQGKKVVLKQHGSITPIRMTPEQARATARVMLDAAESIEKLVVLTPEPSQNLKLLVR